MVRACFAGGGARMEEYKLWEDEVLLGIAALVVDVALVEELVRWALG